MITLVALPTIWLANRSDQGASARPNVAAVGLDPGQADDAGAAAPSFDPMGSVGAAYLEPLSSAQPPAPVVIAVGTTPDEAIGTAKASYRRSVESGICLFNGVDSGQEVDVVNVANGRTTSCTIVSSSELPDGQLVMSQSRFQRIAQLTAAPVHVEIRR